MQTLRCALLEYLPLHFGPCSRRRGEIQTNIPHLTRHRLNLPFKDFPDKMVVESTLPYGRTMMIDGRIAILPEKPKHIPEPVELTTHPLRDVWLLRGVSGIELKKL